jgi:hypothetical protein
MQDEVQGMDCAWDVPAQREQDIDEELGATAAADKYSDWWKKDCEYDN